MLVLELPKIKQPHSHHIISEVQNVWFRKEEVDKGKDRATVTSICLKIHIFLSKYATQLKGLFTFKHV